MPVTREMAKHLNNHAKFPLGGNLYAAVSLQNSGIEINIVKYKALKSIFHPTTIVPTQFGVTLNEKQFQQLINNVPLMAAKMLSMRGSLTALSSEIVQRPSMSSKPSQPITPSIPQVYVEKTIPPVNILPKPTDLGDKAVTGFLSCVPRPTSLMLKNKASSDCMSPAPKDPRRTILLDHHLPLKKRRGRPPSKQRKPKTNIKSVDKNRVMNDTKPEVKRLMNNTNTKPVFSNSAENKDVPTHVVDEIDVPIEIV